ncbi:hypothetical protein POJ06DRAFT_275643 [Lipomyces tetrasporus]|uniref:SEC7 domain-containing protein n=1 Tax=Lipomyces tetrasporus TaxID=54092 RepID=A0AAD7QSI1_9ASCO|nr:uncharacterized protein POJ06DRAFT_275643 [Lipomyces tetrasporus]KAJ8100575.1 hypothetical protein POJ06DRAFT_275643 [Lipomyces tetrasporus]
MVSERELPIVPDAVTPPIESVDAVVDSSRESNDAAHAAASAATATPSSAEPSTVPAGNETENSEETEPSGNAIESVEKPDPSLTGEQSESSEAVQVTKNESESPTDSESVTTEQRRSEPPTPTADEQSGSVSRHRSTTSIASSRISNSSTMSSMMFVSKALESILASRDGRRQSPLQIGLNNAIEQLKKLSPDSPSPVVILEPLRLATLTNDNDVKVTAIDCIGKLFSFSFFVDVPATPEPADGDTVPTLPARSIKIVDQAVEVVCDSFRGDATDERVELQIIKALLAAVLNEKTVVHGAALLKAIRQTYNIFILSRSNANQAIAQATLTQMVNVVFERVKRRINLQGTQEDNSDVIEIPIPPTFDEKGLPEDDDKANEVYEAKEGAGSDTILAEKGPEGQPQTKITLESFENKKSFDEERIPETANSGPRDEEELFIRDAFLVFRAMCKLSIKAIDATDKPDMRSHAMRSKLLSLHLVYTILSAHMIVFTSQDVIIRSSASSEETVFIHAIRQYLCLCLSRNAASPIPPIFEVSCDIFWLILLNLRSQMKKEIEVFMTEIYIPILEMKNSTPHQKQYLLRGIERLFADPRALVEIYLNYDCDNTALDNIFQRLIEYLSRVAVVPVHITQFQLQQYQELQRVNDASSFGGSGSPAGVAIPPSFSSSAAAAMQTSAAAELASQIPLEYTLKRLSLDCLVTILESLVEWSQKGIADAAAIAVPQPNERDSDSIADDETRAGSITPSSALHLSSPLADKGRSIVNGTSGNTTPTDDPSQFESLKHRKTALLEGIKQFNFKPKRGIALLCENNFITSKDPVDVARFLLTTEGLSKAIIGEYLGEGDPENVVIMHAFVDLMDFSDMKFVDALRRFLQAFRLPGESQKIDRFMLKFAERYISGNPSIFANADTAYVLAYSVIMLNTDLHSPQVKNRMSKQDFFKNNKGINDNADLPEAFLSDIFDEILNNEIILKSEHDAALMAGPSPAQPGATSIAANIGQVLATVGRDLQREAYLHASREMANKTELLFKNLVRSQRKETSGPTVIFYSASHFEHVGPMFDVVWMSFLAGLSAPMQDSDEPDIIKSCMEGMKLAVRIACLFDIELARISFVSALAKYTNLQNISEMKPKNVEGTKALLDIALSDGDLLKDSWKDVLTCVSQLERFQLISSGISEGVVPDLGLAKLAPRESFESQRSKSSVSTRPIRSRSSTIATPFSAVVAEETRAREIVVAMDKIFTQSSMLSGDGIVHFVRALTAVSREEIQSSGQSEHPRMFSLQKMVDVCYYNMNRIRFEWSNLWAIMGEQFNNVGCHSNITVVFFALDSLRQLSMRFLEMEELPHFKFQKDFLRTFEHIISNNPSPQVKDMVLRCLQQMVLSRAANIRSGWSAMFGVFTFAAKEQYEPIVQFAFENIKLIHKDDFELIMAQGSFADLAVCLTEFAKNFRFQKISLHSIELLRSSIPRMLEYQKNVLAGTIVVQAASKASIEDPSVKFWFPVLFAFHDIIMTGEDLEVRSRALNYLFDTLVEYGGDFQPDFWDLVCRQLLFPIFIVLKSRSEMSRFNNHEDMSVWLSTTMIQALRNLMALFTHYFDTLERMLDGFLDLLITCICQENDTLARIGSSCLQQLITQNVRKFRKEHWTKIVGAFVTLFETTTAYQLFLSQGAEPPVSPADEIDVIGLKINGLSYPIPNDDIEQAHRERLGDDGESAAPTNGVRKSSVSSISSNPQTPTTQQAPSVVSPAKKREFNKIIVKCVLQLLLIEAVSELFSNDEVYNNIPSEELLVLMRVLRKSFQFARTFNGNRELRIKLWKEGFMKQLPNLLKQESGAASTYIHILLRMYHDPNQDRVENKENIEEALIPLCADIIRGYTILDDETQQRNITAWKPVVVEVIEGYLKFNQEDFARQVEVFYPLGVELLGREPGAEVRVVVQSLFRRIGTVWMKGKGRDL